MYALFHKDEPKAVLTAIVITLAALGTFAFVLFVRLQGVTAEVSVNEVSAADITGWDVYENDTYGFRLAYPPGWTMDESGLADNIPYVMFGNPPSGVKTYALRVFIENNTSSLSSGSYVHAFLDADRAHDAASGAGAGHAPNVTPQFEKTEVLSVGGAAAGAQQGQGPYDAYELYGVFEFDHLGEVIYVAHGNEVLAFDFPVAEENPNISLPVANNGIVHQIINTLVFTK